MPIYLQRIADVKDPGLSRALRWDRAWELFNPDHVGDVPKPGGSWLIGLTGWAWDALGERLGRMVPAPLDPVFFLVPPLTPAGEDYVVRIASFWADEVRYVDADGKPVGPNLWRPPLVDIGRSEPDGPLGDALTEEWQGDRYRYLAGTLGFGRMLATVEIIAPGHASARLHSHSAVDEYYLVVEGRGTLRLGTHAIPVGRGALIGKPTGPDLPSHFIADRGEPLTILDMEVWPDARLHAKDVVHYPDFGEIYFRGPGWAHVVADQALLSADDMSAHYGDGYERHVDGRFTPKDLPGAPQRTPDD